MRLRFLLPLIVFAGVAVALGIGLTLRPDVVPSALVGKPAPEFTLPPLDDEATGFSAADLDRGGVSVVNVFASWCAPCRVEHPQLMALSQERGLAVYGIAYKDKPEHARRFLDVLGNPYGAVGLDLNGRVAIEWGVYGVPETFIINGRGEVVHRHVGPVMEHDLEETILPLIRSLGS